MQRMIHFLKPNRYGIHVGEKRLFDYGPAELLVQRGIASWVDEPVAVAAISEPVAVAEDVSSKDTTKRRQRRSDTIEE
jgi:hypothetical protein